MKTEMAPYCLFFVLAKKLWWIYILQKGGVIE
mgnify:CR=1 FL=1